MCGEVVLEVLSWVRLFSVFQKLKKQSVVCEEACLGLSFEQRRVVTVRSLGMFLKVSKVENKVEVFFGVGGGCCKRGSLCCFVGKGEVLFVWGEELLW